MTDIRKSAQKCVHSIYSKIGVSHVLKWSHPGPEHVSCSAQTPWGGFSPCGAVRPARGVNGSLIDNTLWLMSNWTTVSIEAHGGLGFCLELNFFHHRKLCHQPVDDKESKTL